MIMDTMDTSMNILSYCIIIFVTILKFSSVPDFFFIIKYSPVNMPTEELKNITKLSQNKSLSR